MSEHLKLSDNINNNYIIKHNIGGCVHSVLPETSVAHVEAGWVNEAPRTLIKESAGLIYALASCIQVNRGAHYHLCGAHK